MSRGSSREIEAGMAPRSREEYMYQQLALMPDRQTEVEREKATQQLRQQLSELAEQEAVMSNSLEDLDRLYAGRKRPVQLQIQKIREQREELILELEVKQQQAADYVEPLGPACLAWVDSNCFGALSNLAVVANLSCMFLAPKYPDLETQFHIADQVFLAWYCFELLVKFAYHRRKLFVGKISVVWWNWFDLGIVLSGVLDQWVAPMIVGAAHGSGAGLPVSASVLRTLRLLRLFRILRFLKLIRAFLQGDVAWLQSPAFEIFMSAIIATNAIVMSLELDYDWSGWKYVENTFLALYVFELAIKMKVAGCRFWVDRENIVWNYLDFIIVSAGVLDLWLMPLAKVFEHEVLDIKEGSGVGSMAGGNFSAFPKLMRIFRIFRILRLVRLVKVIKPLYKLLLCVMEALQAMQWVLVLTLIMLYGGAIFWTTLVGKGLIYENSETPEAVERNFGSVPVSLFSLFRMMNGDTDEVHILFDSEVGKLLFVGFTVLSNWAILAILTSVVSDNMIATSKFVSDEESKKERDNEYALRVSRLQALFSDIDTDGSGAISHDEWRSVLKDPGLFHELSDATALNRRDLEELFACLAVEALPNTARGARSQRNPMNFFGDDEQAPPADPGKPGRFAGVEGRIMYYSAFIEQLRDDSLPADKRAVLKMMSRLQNLEDRMETRLDEMWAGIRAVLAPAIAGRAVDHRISAP